MLSFAFGMNAQSKNNKSTNSIKVEKTDKICESGLDIDSCSYLPLYKSFYNWLGTPYRYAGSTKKGIDCSGFTKAVMKEAFAVNLSGGSRDIFAKCTPVKHEELREGDLVFFKISKSNISHVGIYLQDGYFVHASVHGGVMISSLYENYYTKYFYSGGRVKPSA